MAATLIWNVLGGALTLAIAVLVIEEAGSNFQSVVFLLALIGYHRLAWLITEDRQASHVRYLRTETWFHRLDSAIRGAPLADSVAASMLAGVSDTRELEELKDAVEMFARKRRIALWTFTAIEVLLLLAVVSVVLG